MNNQDFIGIGWSFPPTFDNINAKVKMSAYTTDINESLEILFTTIPGERVMLSSFGSDLSPMVFESLSTTLITKMQHQIRDAIAIHEPRIDVDDIIFDQTKITEGILQINIIYTVRATNSRFNFVFPYYIHEGTFVNKN